MRATIHLVSARDCLALHPITQPVIVRDVQEPMERGAGRRVDEITAEGTRVLTFMVSDRAEHHVRFVPSP
jgi:hypothetical protein